MASSPASASASAGPPIGHAGNGKNLPTETVEYLRSWILSSKHFQHPYPNYEEKTQIMEDTGITMKQLKHWFVNNRRRFWRPSVEAKLKELDPADPFAISLKKALGQVIGINGPRKGRIRKKTKMTAKSKSKSKPASKTGSIGIGIRMNNGVDSDQDSDGADRPANQPPARKSCASAPSLRRRPPTPKKMQLGRSRGAAGHGTQQVTAGSSSINSNIENDISDPRCPATVSECDGSTGSNSQKGDEGGGIVGANSGAGASANSDARNKANARGIPDTAAVHTVSNSDNVLAAACSMVTSYASTQSSESVTMIDTSSPQRESRQTPTTAMMTVKTTTTSSNPNVPDKISFEVMPKTNADNVTSSNSKAHVFQFLGQSPKSPASSYERQRRAITKTSPSKPSDVDGINAWRSRCRRTYQDQEVALPSLDEAVWLFGCDMQED